MEWVPWGDRTFKQLLIRVSNTKVVSSIKEGTFTSGFFDLLIFADEVDSKTNRMKRVFIFDEREPKNPLAVTAQEGELMSVKSDTELGASAVLKLYTGNIHNNDRVSNSYQKVDFNEYRLFLNIDEGDAEHTLKPRMIPYGVLKQSIRSSEKGSQGYREFTTELWRRYSVGITPIIFVFLGIGFGTVRTRAVRAGAALTATLVITLYWGAQAVGTVLGQKGYLPAFAAMQFPNFITGVVAYFGYKSSLW
jgi:lipopolysaccharide export system permease protein